MSAEYWNEIAEKVNESKFSDFFVDKLDDKSFKEILTHGYVGWGNTPTNFQPFTIQAANLTNFTKLHSSSIMIPLGELEEMSQTVSQKDLDFWLSKGWNVLLEGDHGIGKSAMIMECFNKHFKREEWAYYSGATMDVFCDLIGVPKEVQDENGISYLKMVQPKEWATDQIKVIFIDELNRANERTRNAVLTLIQFKTMNNRHYPNLEVVWAAINPENGVYDVQPLDPALRDRFPIFAKLDNKLNMEYFTKKYGKHKAQVAKSWHESLPPEQRQLVSPRRLDYSLTIHAQGGNIFHCLDAKTNPKSLMEKLGTTALIKRMQEAVDLGEDGIIQLANNPQYTTEVVNFCLDGGEDYASLFLGVLAEETKANLVVSNEKYWDYLKQHPAENRNLLRSIWNADGKNNYYERIGQLKAEASKNFDLADVLGIIKDDIIVRGKAPKLLLNGSMSEADFTTLLNDNKTVAKAADAKTKKLFIQGCLGGIGSNYGYSTYTKCLEYVTRLLQSCRPGTLINKQYNVIKLVNFLVYQIIELGRVIHHTENLTFEEQVRSIKELDMLNHTLRSREFLREHYLNPIEWGLEVSERNSKAADIVNKFVELANHSSIAAAEMPF
jgi:hypothetical protein